MILLLCTPVLALARAYTHTQWALLLFGPQVIASHISGSVALLLDWSIIVLSKVVRTYATTYKVRATKIKGNF